MPVFDKCLAPKWEYINIRNQHNNYFYWKRSGKYRGVKYPSLGRNTNSEGIKHARALFQHVYLQQQAGHLYLFVPPLNFLKSLLENVEAKKGIPTSQACGLQGMEHSWKWQSLTPAAATKGGTNSNSPLWPSHRRWGIREFSFHNCQGFEGDKSLSFPCCKGRFLCAGRVLDRTT